MDPMEIDDDIYINKTLTIEGLVTQVDFNRRKPSSRCLPVCLGLLCAVLLAGNIGQIIYYEIITVNPTPANYNTLTQDKNNLQNDALTTERNQLQSNSDSLTAEKKQLEASLSNLTKEKDQLQQSYNSLSTERDELKASLNNLQSARERLKANYSALKQESDQLHTSYNDMQRNLERLQTKHSNVTSSKDQLRAKYSNVQREKDELQTRFSTLMANRDQLQSNYSLMKRDMDQLQRSYSTLRIRENYLQTSYNSLWKDKDQLQNRYNSLWRVKEWLQTNYSSLTTVRDQLQKKADKMTVKVKGMLCQTGWRMFDVSCYFISTLKKNWTESRKACITQRADLVVIDSRDEQAFVNGLLETGQNAWIGLSDSNKEGDWMWVDGSPFTTQFWQSGQPNNYNGKQDCGEIVQKSFGSVGEWNDDGCFAEQKWICEK